MSGFSSYDFISHSVLVNVSSFQLQSFLEFQVTLDKKYLEKTTLFLHDTHEAVAKLFLPLKRLLHTRKSFHSVMTFSIHFHQNVQNLSRGSSVTLLGTFDRHSSCLTRYLTQKLRPNILYRENCFENCWHRSIVLVSSP